MNYAFMKGQINRNQFVGLNVQAKFFYLNVDAIMERHYFPANIIINIGKRMLKGSQLAKRFGIICGNRRHALIWQS